MATFALVDPIRSIAPCASTGSAGSLRSKSRYLKLVLPRLATRTFKMRLLREGADDDRVGPGNDVGRAQLTDLARSLGAGLDGRTDAADIAANHHADDSTVKLDDLTCHLDARR